MRLRTLSVVVLLLALAAPAAGEGLARSAILVSYDFDGEEPSTGPDTFTLVQEGRGRVRLTDAHAFSGRNAVEIHDAAGDGAFPDFLGHLPLRRDGFLFVHFAWMVENPRETLNIGLLGPRWCTIAKDGISFWLFLENGTLYHVSGRSSRPLFRPEPGHWYLFDLFYDVGRGRYDLVVQDAEGERVTDVQGAENPAGVPGSAVLKFSFAGDLEEARAWLHRPAESALAGTDRELLARLQEGAIDARLVAAVKRRFPERWHDPIRETLVADQYFFVLLWSERAAEAERYAHGLAHRLHALGLTSRKWMERAADAAFVQGRLDVAEHRYHVALHENPHPTSPLLKLSDVYHAQGNRAKERQYRQMVYGGFR